MAKKRISGKQIFSIITALLTLVANILVVTILLLANKYSGLETKTFYSVFGILVCLIIVVDIIFFVGFNYRDNALKVVTCVIAVLITLGGAFGTYYLARINNAVSNIVNNQDGETYETIRVSIATYDNKNIDSIEDLAGKKVGSLSNSGVSAASVGRNHLTKNGIEPTYKEYNMTSELYQALIEGEIDAAIFPSTYRSQLSNDDDGFDSFLEKTTDILKFEEKVVTSNSETSKIDISVEPFNILLIGYAPEPGGGGLTDAIIVASVNPQTMSTTMVSIPRDSYVPISCYNNARSKINDAGAASKACLMETVGNLLEIDIDFYMEVNFQGLVDIVDALGGILINSPIEFVAQNSSSNRGEMTVWVPAGEVLANGEQALAFARERKLMPNGDFDRQVHQQEVISEIVRRFMDLKDINQALAVMDAAGENFSTNLSISQLTSIFNYMLKAPNYTGMPQFDMLDIQSSRVTGYTRWFYSYSMSLPLWSYYLWDGSIKDNVELLDETLGHYDTIKQDPIFKFFVEYPYDRGPLFHEYYDEPRVPEDMPPYYPKLTNMTYSEALAWAEANGVTLEVITINEGESGYDANAIGSIVSQNPAYGTLVEGNTHGSITVIGSPLSEEDKVPNFVGKSIYEVRDWANANGYSVVEKVESNTDDSKGGKVITQSIAAGSDKSLHNSIEVSYYEIPTISTSELDAGVGTWTKTEIEAWMKKMGVTTSPVYTKQESTTLAEGTLISYSVGKPVGKNSTFTFILASKAATPTCGANASLVNGACVCNSGYEGDPLTGCTLIPSPSPSPTTPTCGSNAHYDESAGACVCDSGFVDDGSGACIAEGGGSGGGGGDQPSGSGSGSGGDQPVVAYFLGRRNWLANPFSLNRFIK